MLEATDADLERRFGGLKRLHGDADYTRLRALRIAVVGLGGVGSWAVEALARSGVASLVLIDMDHVAESNINRQVQATSHTLGQAKGEALQARICLIHPGCEVRVVDAFVEPPRVQRDASGRRVVDATSGNWPALLLGAQGVHGALGAHERIDGLIDACDQVRTKAVLAAWALEHRVALVCAGAAGGKRDPTRLEVDDLGAVTHDPLLAALRQCLRKEHGLHLPLRGDGLAKSTPWGVRCVFSRESVSMPEACAVDGSLNCHGYGSSVMVTASMGLALAAEITQLALV